MRNVKASSGTTTATSEAVDEMFRKCEGERGGGGGSGGGGGGSMGYSRHISMMREHGGDEDEDEVDMKVYVYEYFADTLRRACPALKEGEGEGAVPYTLSNEVSDSLPCNISKKAFLEFAVPSRRGLRQVEGVEFSVPVYKGRGGDEGLGYGVTFLRRGGGEEEGSKGEEVDNDDDNDHDDNHRLWLPNFRKKKKKTKKKKNRGGGREDSRRRRRSSGAAAAAAAEEDAAGSRKFEFGDVDFTAVIVLVAGGGGLENGRKVRRILGITDGSANAIANVSTDTPPPPPPPTNPLDSKATTISSLLSLKFPPRSLKISSSHVQSSINPLSLLSASTLPLPLLSSLLTTLLLDVPLLLLSTSPPLLLSSVTLLTSTLLEPRLKYHHLVLPTCSTRLARDVVHCPTPFVLGVDSAFANGDDFFDVDVDVDIDPRVKVACLDYGLEADPPPEETNNNNNNNNNADDDNNADALAGEEMWRGGLWRKLSRAVKVKGGGGGEVTGEERGRRVIGACREYVWEELLKEVGDFVVVMSEGGDDGEPTDEGEGSGGGGRNVVFLDKFFEETSEMGQVVERLAFFKRFCKTQGFSEYVATFVK